MKKNPERILGRRLARAITLEEMAAATQLDAARIAGFSTWSLSYPAEGTVIWDHGSGIF
jgi:hypothetical protein